MDKQKPNKKIAPKTTSKPDMRTKPLMSPQEFSEAAKKMIAESHPI